MTLLTTTVTKRAQTVVPASIRRRHNIQPGDVLAWIDDGETIKVVPVSQDPEFELLTQVHQEPLPYK